MQRVEGIHLKGCILCDSSDVTSQKHNRQQRFEGGREEKVEH
jgi:hypothetical protein